MAIFKINILGLSGLAKDTGKEIQAFKERIAIQYARLGELFVNKARESGDYQDQTTNLRNSAAYRVYIDGVIFNESKMRPETDMMFNGMKVSKGIQLVVGSGMEYASLVEGKGYDVASSGFHLVERELANLQNTII